MDHVLRRAVGLGLSPVRATCMTASGDVLRRGAGSGWNRAGPVCGYGALLEDLESFRVQATLIEARWLRKRGSHWFRRSPVSVPYEMMQLAQLHPNISEKYPSSCPMENPKIRVIELINQILLRRGYELDARCCCVEADVDQDFIRRGDSLTGTSRSVKSLWVFWRFGAKIGAAGTTTDLKKIRC